MRADLIEQLRRANPVADDPPMLPIEPVLRRLDAEPLAPPDGSREVRGRVWGAARGVPVAVSGIVVVAVAAVVITTGGRTRPGASSHRPPARQTIAQTAASQFAVFRRPQTAKDRSLPTVLHQAVTLGGLGPGFRSILHGAIPSLTRYTQTLPDGREVFLAVYRPSTLLPPGAPERATKLPAHTVWLKIIIVQPEGKWTNGQPVMDPGGTWTAGDAYLETRAGREACGLTTYWDIVPNQVARIRWQFPRQDRYGYVYNAPLTVNLPVHGNTAVATIPTRAPCDRPSVVTLYGHHGQTLSQTGSATNLNRITRPIRHGNPLAGVDHLEARAQQSAQPRQKP